MEVRDTGDDTVLYIWTLVRKYVLKVLKKKTVTMIDVNQTYLWWSFHSVYKYQTIMLYIWNKYFIYQLYLNKRSMKIIRPLIHIDNVFQQMI